MTRIDGRWLVHVNTVGGIALTLGLVAGAYVLLGGSGAALAHPEAATIVLAAAVAGLLACCAIDDITAALRAVRPAFTDRASAEDVIDSLVRAARIARRQGLISLEHTPPTNAHPFLVDALSMAADGVGPEIMRQVLDVQQRAMRRRDDAPAAVITTASACAMWAGAFGTLLIGLAALQSEAVATPAALAAPAVAALFYGFGLAALLRPIAARMRRRAAEAAFARELITDGALGIRDGLTPRLIEQALRGRAGLPPAETLVEAPRRAA
jgi:chemotaxis protein MotA